MKAGAKARIHISGLKLNGPLAAIWVDPADVVPDPLSYLCRLLDRNHVNIAYMTAGDPLASGPGLCCIDRADIAKVAALLDEDTRIGDHIRFGHDVGLVTIYPHGRRFAPLGMVLQQLGEHDIRIYGLASSIAALSFVVDFDQLDRAHAILNEQFNMPDNATPPWSSIKTRQASICRD